MFPVPFPPPSQPSLPPELTSQNLRQHIAEGGKATLVGDFLNEDIMAIARSKVAQKLKTVDKHQCYFVVIGFYYHYSIIE